MNKKYLNIAYARYRFPHSENFPVPHFYQTLQPQDEEIQKHSTFQVSNDTTDSKYCDEISNPIHFLYWLSQA